MVPLSFASQEFLLTQAGALYWPRESAVLVADLHLEKASFFAKHGQMLPPYDSRETLGRIAQAIRETGAKRVFSLGDNFHDGDGTNRLEPYAAGMLKALTHALDWVWITGNHDPDLDARTGGTVVQELQLGGLMLRHEAQEGETRPELSGHFHPKLRIVIRNRQIRRPCAVMAHAVPDPQSALAVSGDRMILPAFGSLTGGMDAADPAIIKALQPAERIEALIPAAGKLARFELWRKAA